jgi:hypothetical protein
MGDHSLVAKTPWCFAGRIPFDSEVPNLPSQGSLHQLQPVLLLRFLTDYLPERTASSLAFDLLPYISQQ